MRQTPSAKFLALFVLFCGSLVPSLNVRVGGRASVISTQCFQRAHAQLPQTGSQQKQIRQAVESGLIGPIFFAVPVGLWASPIEVVSWFEQESVWRFTSRHHSFRSGLSPPQLLV